MSTKPAIRAVVTHRFHAPAERVFDAWLSRPMLGRWIVGPAVSDEEIVHLSVTPRVGGAFSFLVTRDDDGSEVEYVGKYLEIARPHRLVFTWIKTDETVGSRVVVEVTSGETGCEITVTQELHPSRAEEIGRTEIAWSHRLETLALALESPAT